jgi:hypothetical protein
MGIKDEIYDDDGHWIAMYANNADVQVSVDKRALPCEQIRWPWREQIGQAWHSIPNVIRQKLAA